MFDCFQSWKINSDSNCVFNITSVHTNHYLLDVSKDRKNDSEWEEFLVKLVQTKVDILENSTIEFWFDNKKEVGLPYHKIEGENAYLYPTDSFVYSFSDSQDFFVSFNVDMETYKYKTFSQENQCIVSRLSKNKLISFDPTFFHGVIYRGEKNQPTNSYHLFIQVWNTPRSDISVFQNQFHFDFSPSVQILTGENISKLTVNTSILSNFFLENLLYKKTYDTLDSLFDQIKENRIDLEEEIDDLFVQSKFLPLENKLFYQELENKYSKELMKDFYEIMVEPFSISNENRFFKKQILSKVIPQDNCQWIVKQIEECAKFNGGWNTTKYDIPNISVENINYLFNFIIISFGKVFEKINETYGFVLENKLNLNINDFLIFKYEDDTKNEFLLPQNKSFFQIHILLNGNSDDSKDVLYFSDSKDDYFLETGDLLIYSNHSSHSEIKMNKTKNKTKYMLTCFMDVGF